MHQPIHSTHRPCHRPCHHLAYPLAALMAALAPACTGTGGALESASGTSGGSTGAGSTGTASSSTTTGGGGTGTGGDTGGSSTGTTFIVDQGPDNFGCDVWAQDCPEGEKCVPWANDGGSSWNALKCEPVDPNPKQPGDSCSVEGNGVSGVDDCDLGAMCWNVNPDTNEGTCVAFCQGSKDTPTCEAGSSCVIVNDGVLILCLPECDPLLQDCQGNDLCLPNTNGGDFVCVLNASGDMAPAGTPCEFANSCNGGHICANADAVPGCMGALGCCAPYCDVTDAGANADCNNAFETPGAECVPFFNAGEAPPGLDDVGVCLLPQ